MKRDPRRQIRTNQPLCRAKGKDAMHRKTKNQVSDDDGDDEELQLYIAPHRKRKKNRTKQNPSFKCIYQFALRTYFLLLVWDLYV